MCLEVVDQRLAEAAFLAELLLGVRARGPDGLVFVIGFGGIETVIVAVMVGLVTGTGFAFDEQTVNSPPAATGPHRREAKRKGEMDYPTPN